MSDGHIELRLSQKDVEYVQEALRHYYRSQDHFGLVTEKGKEEFRALWSRVENGKHCDGLESLANEETRERIRGILNSVPIPPEEFHFLLDALGSDGPQQTIGDLKGKEGENERLSGTERP